MAASKRDDTAPSDSPPERPQAAEAGEQAEQSSSSSDREERIRQTAYELSERRGFESGRDVDDWLEAERQVDVGGGGKAG